MGRELKVEIVGDASALSRAFGEAGKNAEGFGSKLGNVTKAAGLMIGAAGIGGLAFTLKTGIDEFQQSSKVAAQTAAVLKSTGGAAGVTAGQVDKLATSLMNKSGVDDEAIKSGENLLLTFTNIRNEAGAGNDVFNQTTKVALDMSSALGESTTTAAMQLGKALNDPVKGMTALQRVGVSFTEGQKKQVEAMVKSGDTIGAQKLMLRELNKEFGGSAEAAGKTLPGQLSILREQFNNFAGDLIAKMLPTFEKLVRAITDAAPKIEALAGQAFTRLSSIVRTVAADVADVVRWFDRHRTAAEALAGAIAVGVAGLIAYKTTVAAVNIATEAYAAVQALATGAQQAWAIVTGTSTVATEGAATAQEGLNVAMSANPIGLIVTAVAGLAAGFVILYERSNTVRDAVNAFGDACKDVFKTVEAIVKPIIATVVSEIQKIAKVVGDVFTLVNDLVHGRWDKLWADVKTLALDYIGALLGTLGGLPGRFLGAAESIGSSVVSGIVNFVEKLPGKVRDLLGDVVSLMKALPAKIVAAVGDLGKVLFNAGRQLIEGLLDGIKSMMGAVESTLGGIAHDAVSWKGPPEYDSVVLFDNGRRLMQGLTGGVKHEIPGFKSLLGSVAPMAARTFDLSGIRTGGAGRVALAGGGGDVHVHVHVAGSLMGSTPAEIGRTLMPHVRDALKRDGRRNTSDGFS